MSLYITLELLTEQDFCELFRFESENRTFFERSVPGRGDDYYQYPIFTERNRALLEEQAKGLSFFFLIRKNGEIAGRVNAVDIDSSGCGHIGYRVSERFAGQGVASEGVALLIGEAERLGMACLLAKTTQTNIGSQQVLKKNGFEITAEEQEFIHFRKEISCT
ncbi:GNAT family N-acetyltransferase [Indiicoccus explosivorum]|uniref:GNAT family N-acetyltransferase n=1 Tax=Indiicoccus explosivorum TaxID=1917864 RepID=UPI001F4E97C1|nr:GNAT family N-acetyltransferase [Indiicoccus explosivorum]